MENKENTAPKTDQRHPDPKEDVQQNIETVVPDTEDMKPLDGDPEPGNGTTGETSEAKEKPET